MTGKCEAIKLRNQIEAYQPSKLAQEARDDLIFQQLVQRHLLQDRLNTLGAEQAKEIGRPQKAVFSKLPEEKLNQIELGFDRYMGRERPSFDTSLEIWHNKKQ